jgi:DNA-binding CsgD family transcriptional regulator
LRGRRSERESLEQLVTSVRAGQSRVLVLRGEAGIGKTALLEYLASCATECRIARAAGVESEMELAFAGLHQLCAPFLDRLGRLPGPQRDALGTAFGLRDGNAPDRFLIGLAALSLLSDVAEEQPLVCLVDDAHWLDQASADTLAFVARRLFAESVALVLATRTTDEDQAFRQLPEILVRGLGDADSRTLIRAALHGPLDAAVLDEIVAEARGNPLALLELPRGRTPAQLAFGLGLPNTMPLASRLEQGFLRRLEALPADTQRLLLTAAAEPVGDVTLLWRAAERLGIGTHAASAALSAGLVEIDTRVRFRHPLVRSAAYRAAGLPDRQEVHRALAEATDPEVDPDRRAWHRAHAAVGPDEAVALELERSADRAQGRGGVASAAAFLARATELTPDPARRAARALAAAQATFEAAEPDAAYELLTAAEIGPLDALQRARLERLRAQIVFARRRGNEAAPLLLDAAKRLAPFDGGSARETYLEALGAAIFGGRISGHSGVREAAEAARAAPPAPHPPRPIDLLLDGVVARFTEGYVAGVPILRHALQAFRQEALHSKDDITRWLWLAYPIAQEVFIHELWDDEAWHELATRAVRLARDAGALTALPTGLVYRAGVHLHAGEFTAASALIEEADTITAATGNARVRYTSLVLAAWRGEEAPALELIEADVRDATARGEGRLPGMAGYVTAVLYNGLGNYEAALAGAGRACEHEDLGFFGWSLTELVEAASRSGAHADAADALRQLEGRTSAAGTDWALGILARSRALLSEGRAADDLYRESIERITRTRMTVHLARAHLVYGEWLRRESRRLDAREQLHTAYQMLSQIGAEAFAERARRELLATGETVRKRTVATRGALTAQEAQIARLAARRQTNSEIGARLFISPRTVEWHLRKVFTKLGISSRRELSAALPDADQATSPRLADPA